MKNRYVLALCTLALGTRLAVAQITITSADVNAATSPGNSTTSYSDSTTVTLDIGTTGSGAWNFSGLVAQYSNPVQYVAPASTPFAGYYPSSTTVAYTSVVSPDTMTIDLWTYQRVDTAFVNLGMAEYATTAAGDTIYTRSTHNPWAEGFLLPLTYPKNWTRSYTTTTVMSMGGFSFQTTSQVTATATVDGYGPVTFPGGSVEQCLRMKLDRRILTTSMFGPPSYSRQISYTWSARTGSNLSATAADTTSPDTGTIPVIGICWVVRTVTAAEEHPVLPATFALEQNYPNPFNPTTVVSYQVPVASPVRLGVYDLLGREVAVLVNEEKAPGRYEVSFDGTGLASGVYFYRLAAGSYAETRKLMLLR